MDGDYMTKPLVGVKFVELHKRIMGYDGDLAVAAGTLLDVVDGQKECVG